MASHNVLQAGCYWSIVTDSHCHDMDVQSTAELTTVVTITSVSCAAKLLNIVLRMLQ
jgi:hypothetical protein